MNRIIWRLILPGFLLMLLISGECLAQQVSSFEQLQLLVKPGDKVYVTDFSGNTTKGRISELSKSSLGVKVDGARRDWLQKDVREIQQWRGDSLRNGALIGAVAGGGSVAILIAIYCGSEGCNEEGGAAAAAIGLYTGIGAAAGAGIDALIPHKQTIFRNENQGSARKLQIRPILNRSSKGVEIALSF